MARWIDADLPGNSRMRSQAPLWTTALRRGRIPHVRGRDKADRSSGSLKETL